MASVARRLLFYLVCAAIAAGASWFGQPLVHENSDAILIIITVMTVFAGFLVAIIAILGDPSNLPEGTWRTAEVTRPAIFARVVLHTWLFRLYLLAIALLFIGVLAKKLPDCGYYPIWKVWVERAYLFFGVFAFLLTLALPGMLADLQMSRVEAEIERRRRQSGLGGGQTP